MAVTRIESIGVLGYGRFGRAFCDLVGRAGVHWKALDPHVDIPAAHRADSVAALTDDVDAVFLATPVHSFNKRLSELVAWVGPEHIVVDVGSVKLGPQQAMEELLGDAVPWVATHPLFGPVSLARGERPLSAVVCSNDRHPDAVRAVEDLYRRIGCDVIGQDADAHDRNMANTHALVFFIAKGLLELGPQPDTSTAPASYRAIARAVEAVRSDAGHLFVTIQNDNPHAGPTRRRFLDALSDVDERLHLAEPPARDRAIASSSGAARRRRGDSLAIPGLDAPAADLVQTRELIDELDTELLQLLARRATLARRAAASKAKTGKAVHDPQRERELLDDRAQRAAELGLDPGAIRDIFVAIMRQSRILQRRSNEHLSARLRVPASRNPVATDPDPS